MATTPQSGEGPNGTVCDEIVDLRWHTDVEALVRVGRPPIILVFGDPGSGKSTALKHLAVKLTGKPPLVIDGTPETEMSHIHGRYVWKGNEKMDFVEGPLPRALRESAAASDFRGARFVLVEEFAAIPLEVRATFLPLRQEREFRNSITHEVLPVSPYFRLLATSNHEVLSSCRKNPGLAQAIFSGCLLYSAPEVEETDIRRFIEHEFPKADRPRLDRVLSLWQDYRALHGSDGSKQFRLTSRSALELYRLLESGMTEQKAIEVALVNKFAPADPELYSAARIKNQLSDGTQKA